MSNLMANLMSQQTPPSHSRVLSAESHLKTLRWLVLAVVISAFTLLARPVHAQSLAQQTRRLSGNAYGAGPAHIVSVNPFLPLFGYFSGEYEQRVAPNVSLAIAGSHTKFDDTQRTNLDAKVRLYPQERGLQGLGVAASLGFGHIKDDNAFYCASIDNFEPICPDLNKPFNTASFGIEASYQWMLGPSRATAITVGGGAKRYLGSESHYNNGNGSIERVIPTVRLSIGYAF